MIAKSIYDALTITGFVLLMMLIIEYLNVITRGSWQNALSRRGWVQYPIVILLGATPGCFGAFAVVAMFSHRVVTLGAVVAAMIATSGDEAFVMLALFPEKALLLTAILMAVALAAGWSTDRFVTGHTDPGPEKHGLLEIHDESDCDAIPKESFIRQWLQLSLIRLLSCAVLLIFVLGVLAGIFGPNRWGWERVALFIAGSIGFVIAAYAPDHFLRAHLWGHIVRKHTLGIFLWTLGALLVASAIMNNLDLKEVIQANSLFVLLSAAFVGLIPESGPHLVFTTLYAQGLVPFVVLLTNSIVQDGHGMLPLLAHSRRLFLIVKTINLAVGLVVGLVVYVVGYIW